MARGVRATSHKVIRPIDTSRTPVACRIVAKCLTLHFLQFNNFNVAANEVIGARRLSR